MSRDARGMLTSQKSLREDPSTISLAQAKAAVRARAALRNHFFGLATTLLFLISFASMLALVFPTQDINLAESGLRQILLSSSSSSGVQAPNDSNAAAFLHIRSHDDILQWVHQRLLPSIYADKSNDDGAPIFFAQAHQLLSVQLLVTTRQPTSCRRQLFNQSRMCYRDAPTSDDLVHHPSINLPLSVAVIISNSTLLDQVRAMLRANESLAFPVHFHTISVALVTYTPNVDVLTHATLTITQHVGGSIEPRAAFAAASIQPYDQGAVQHVLDATNAVFVVSILVWYVGGGAATAAAIGLDMATLVLVVGFYGLWAWHVYATHDAVRALAAAAAPPGPLVLALARQMTLLQGVASVVLGCLASRIVGAMAFHPTLGLVTLTLHRALSHLVSFAVVFGLTLFVFAATGRFVLGGSAFATYGQATTTTFRMLLVNPVDLVIDDTSGHLATLWILAMRSVLGLVLLNIVVAIVLDAYATVQARSMDGRRRRPMAREFLMVLQQARHAVTRRTPHATFLAALHNGSLDECHFITWDELATRLQLSRADATNVVAMLKSYAPTWEEDEEDGDGGQDEDELVAEMMAMQDQLARLIARQRRAHA
ncbi:Aste57867_24041 [Aphanomyces stellatus]|uniref:Aste57867_24041 protein n=1 Tax=Aphanomyces stellatus TaxID=120398 RepID=A0A485LQG5_9STRA|nr:hypothetical protein As57867_023968 [Aphanomyces stellatus]VFU00684.1 Aste57867_24041 [Aphanomyces stellatus]